MKTNQIPFSASTFYVAVVGAILAMYSPANATLIANWTLDETSGQLAVDSVNGYNGQLGVSAGAEASDPLVNQAGPVGTAYAFTASESDRIDLSAQLANFTSLNAGSITGWFNLSDTPRGALLNFGEAGTSDRLLLETTGPGDIRFIVREANVNVTDLTSTGTNFEDGLWHHFAVLNDGADTRLLIDAAEVALSSNIDAGAWFNDVNNVNSFTLGYEVRVNGTFPLNGQLDDIAVFDQVLTDQQLANVINFGAANYAIPEPSSMALLVLGGLVLGVRRSVRCR